MANEKELDTLIEQCKSQNRKAQKNLYEMYAKKLLAICYRYSKSDAEDTLQLAFVKIFKNINNYEGFGSFEGWMKKIVVNTAITEFHKKNILQNASDIVDYEESSLDDKYGDVIAQIRSEELLKIINELPDIYRVTFNLYAIEGYKHNEIAEMLQISDGTSKSQLSRARKLLQERLEEINKKENSTKYA